MGALFILPQACAADAALATWLATRPAPWRELAQNCFAQLRACGPDVQECLHDGHATACVQMAAFAYVNVFSAHLNLGFFHGAHLPDPAALLCGSGKNMRHIKLKPGASCDTPALQELIAAAYADIHQRLRLQHSGAQPDVRHP
ncbi:DUF1801 domain-containing protein [Massilia sp. W12]|uniref:DUF1801 domain-containing protein n=1 Tax=Massilia sp. W12 TaxID=3126507 RepID=UPI0030D3F344